MDLVQQLVEHKHVLEAGVHALTVKGHHGVRGVVRSAKADLSDPLRYGVHMARRPAVPKPGETRQGHPGGPPQKKVRTR